MSSPQSLRFLAVIRQSTDDEIVSGNWIFRFLPADIDANVLTERVKKIAQYCLMQVLWSVAIEATQTTVHQPNVPDVPKPARVIGDINGQWVQLARSMRMDAVDPSDAFNLDSTPLSYVFTGNIACKGYEGVACLFTLLALKAKYPTRVYLLRGIQENETQFALPFYSPTIFEALLQYQIEPATVNLSYMEDDHAGENSGSYTGLLNTWSLARNFVETIRCSTGSRFPALIAGCDKYVSSVFERICGITQVLPVAVVIGGDVFVSHGGIPDGELVDKTKTVLGDLREQRALLSKYIPETYVLPEVNTTLDVLRVMGKNNGIIALPTFIQPPKDLELTLQTLSLDIYDNDEMEDEPTGPYADLNKLDDPDCNDIKSMDIPEKDKNALRNFRIKAILLNRIFHRIHTQVLWNKPASDGFDSYSEHVSPSGFIPSRLYSQSKTMIYTGLGVARFQSENSIRFLLRSHVFHPIRDDPIIPSVSTGITCVQSRQDVSGKWSTAYFFTVDDSSLLIHSMESNEITTRRHMY